MNHHLKEILALSFVVVSGTTALDVAEGCNNPAGQNVVSTLPPLGACVIQAGGSDFVDAISDPATLIPAIISQCAQYGLLTAAAIVSYIESWFASAPAVDAGPDGAAGAPLSTQATRLRKVMSAALAYQGIVVTFGDK